MRKHFFKMVMECETQISDLVNIRKKSFVNEGKFPSVESQIDSLAFGIVASIRFSNPINDNNGLLHIKRTLGCLSKEDFKCSL